MYLATVTEPQARLLDKMADGQWHTIIKIQRHSGKGFTSVDEMRAFLKALIDEGYVLAGANNSYRFVLPYLEEWRLFRNMSSTGSKDLTSPRYFGGILEDDGWLLAPLRVHDLVHFRAGRDTTVQVIQKKIGMKGVVNQDADGLIRISTVYGDPIYSLIKEWSKEEGVDISGVRLDKNVRRRELIDLPSRYVDGLCTFYGTFAHTLLRKNMTSVHKHIAEKDDVQQQIYIWIIDAIQRYDAETSIPFAAYLHSSLQRWVHDLNRKSYGRAAADNELRYTRAISTFTSEYGRKPTISELACILKDTEATVREKMASITRVNNLRSVSTLDAEDFDIPVVSNEDHERDFHADVERTLLSAALTSAALEAYETPHVLAWISIYDKNWGKGKVTGISKRSGEEKVLVAMRSRVKDIVE